MKIALTRFKQGGRGWMAILSSKGEGNDPWADGRGSGLCMAAVSREGVQIDLTEHCPVLRTCASTRARWDAPEQAPLSPFKPSGTGTMANRRCPCPSPLPPLHTL